MIMTDPIRQDLEYIAPVPQPMRQLVERVRRVVRSLPARIGTKTDRRHALASVTRFPVVHAPRRHDLSGQLIVSVTSYSRRFPTLPHTLRSLLDQTVRADRTVLWIAHDDMPMLTPEILSLRDHGLDILACDDLRSYKKIIPALQRWPESFIVTADDDVFYEPGWLAELTAGYDAREPAIVCRRGHRPARDARGELRPYDEWRWQVVDHRPTKDGIFPTGVGGVLYPPNSLAPEVTDHEAFMELCAYGDDIWLYWMGRRAGATYRQVGPYFRAIEWQGTQETSLFRDNARGRNDQQIQAMRRHFGSV